MKHTQEFEGKNVENAIEKACSALNISKKNLVYDVISSGSTGIFGIVGVKKARIRVTLSEMVGKEGRGVLSSYDSDRAGVMSIVDEAFGKDITPSISRQYSENLASENRDLVKGDIYSDSVDSQDKENSEAVSLEPSANKKNVRDSEPKRHLESKKRYPVDKPTYPKSKKCNPSKKVATEKLPNDSIYSEIATNGKSSVENIDGGEFENNTLPFSDRGEFQESKLEETLISTFQEQITKRTAKSKTPTSRHESPKPYSRNKNRSKKRDTWLKDDGDDVLSEAIEAMDSSTDTIMTSKGDKKSSYHKKRYFPKPNSSSKETNGSFSVNEYVNEIGVVDVSEPYNVDIDDEFLNEDFNGGDLEHAISEEDDAPYIKDDDEIIEADDERDDGYPPKYKGDIPVDVSEEAIRIGRETLQKMVSLITDDATVTAQGDEDRLLLKVEGGNSGVLIGRRGQTLEAMQYLTDKIINKFSESRVRLKVDIEGYMETRKANLKTLAYKMADKAKKTGKPATINQMTAQDRRVIHLSLKDDPRVRTQSMGDGYYRRLVIFPKKSSFRRKKNFRK